MSAILLFGRSVSFLLLVVLFDFVVISSPAGLELNLGAGRVIVSLERYCREFQSGETKARRSVTGFCRCENMKSSGVQ